jgi:hypothetical protein
MALRPTSVVSIMLDNTNSVVRSIRGLGDMQVLIGIPQFASQRQNAGEPTKATNALIGYVQEFGDASRNLPPRPHLVPGVMAEEVRSIEGLKRAGTFAVNGDYQATVRQMMAIGTRNVSSVKQIIRSKIPPPLAEATVVARLRRTKAGRKRLTKMMQAGTDLASWGTQNLTPLIDTSDYINHITYVVRDRKTGHSANGPVVNKKSK